MELLVYLLVISLVEGSMLLTAAFMFVLSDGLREDGCEQYGTACVL